jgi:hypothetical protein
MNQRTYAEYHALMSLRRNLPPEGTRIVVAGNLHEYATALVTGNEYVPTEARWRIELSWPNSPGGPGSSYVWDTDEGKVWYRYGSSN